MTGVSFSVVADHVLRLLRLLARARQLLRRSIHIPAAMLGGEGVGASGQPAPDPRAAADDCIHTWGRWRRAVRLLASDPDEDYRECPGCGLREWRERGVATGGGWACFLSGHDWQPWQPGRWLTWHRVCSRCGTGEAVWTDPRTR